MRIIGGKWWFRTGRSNSFSRLASSWGMINILIMIMISLTQNEEMNHSYVELNIVMTYCVLLKKKPTDVVIIVIRHSYYKNLMNQKIEGNILHLIRLCKCCMEYIA